MKRYFFVSIFLGILSAKGTKGEVLSSSLLLMDKERKRPIPVEIYGKNKKAFPPIVIINHGYTIKNTSYTFLAKALNTVGYNVVSIQHDLSFDPPLPREGNIFILRQPFWRQGVENLLFVIKELKKSHPALNLRQIILIGHSNGGDICMMFLDRYPHLVQKVISLDSLRYPFPVDKGVPILHFRVNDTKADSGVIPEKGLESIFLPDAKHNDLCDRGTPQMKEIIVNAVIPFLKKQP